MKIDIIDKYIAKETMSPFIVTLLATSALMLVGRMVRFFDLIIAKGVSIGQVTLLFLYMSPFILALSIPISVLVSVVLSFNRLSADSEVIAMKAIGIKVSKLARAPLWIGFIAYIATSFISFYLLPVANVALKDEFFNIIIRKTTVGIDAKAFNNFTSKLVFYVDSLSKNREVMNHVIIYDTRTSDKIPSTIIARQGRFIVDKRDRTITLSLQDGVIQQLGAPPETLRLVKFKDYDLSFSQREVSPSMSYYNEPTFEMTIPELMRQYRALKREHKPYRSLLTDIAERFAIPFTVIIFAVIGVPLGIKSPRSGKAYGIIIAVVLVLLYYIVLSGAETVGKLGIMSPVVAVALVDLLFLAAALGLLVLVAKESEIGVSRLIAYIKRLM